MRKVSYKNVLRDLYEETDLQKNNTNEIYLARLIRKADKRIEGLYTVNLDKLITTVENNIIEFPEALFNVDYILLGDYTDQNVYFLNTSTPFYINLEHSDYVDWNENGYRLWSDMSYVIEKNKIDFVIANGQINIDPYYDGETVTLVYTKYPVNEKNEFLINENHIDPIIAFVKHQVFERQMFKKKMSAGRLFQDDFVFQKQLKSNKNLLIRNARVQDRKLNEEFVTKGIVVNSYNVMIENDSF